LGTVSPAARLRPHAHTHTATYGHLAPDAEEQERALLDVFDKRANRAEAAVD
jgi:hypothetical protein